MSTSSRASRSVSLRQPKHSSVTIVLSSGRVRYCEGDTVLGNILLEAKDGWKHDNIVLVVRGGAEVTLPCPSQSSAPLTASFGLMEEEILIKPSGYLGHGDHAIPFSFVVKGIRGASLPETYRGVHVKISYRMSVFVRRGFFSRYLDDTKELMIENLTSSNSDVVGLDEFKPFIIVPSHNINVVDRPRHCLLSFKITGQLGRRLAVNRPLTGSLVVGESVLPIRSIELCLSRGEIIRNNIPPMNAPGKCDARLLHLPPPTFSSLGRNTPSAKQYHHGQQHGFTRVCTEIQTWQVVDGDVMRGIKIPIRLPLPDRELCVTTEFEGFFKLQFDVRSYKFSTSSPLVFTQRISIFKF
uniref:Arrestin-like N-terminal domain-containing protein n=1 Tax=Corethron hystrix TaxID=216773 RepID=A0A7S1BJR6_9STRA|mmetsp:Transcript_29162/g.66895  ORF Transcript_29162/g.66895 Transcript_29162/m.66895 type:complete len:354 (+) Transcript_29162:141-1202(+)